jgi:hypothetical protein
MEYQMASRNDLTDWVVDAVRKLGGSASVLDVAKQIWADHESDLRSSGSLFFTWQYDMRWAADRLRRKGKFLPIAACEKGKWTVK